MALRMSGLMSGRSPCNWQSFIKAIMTRLLCAPLGRLCALWQRSLPSRGGWFCTSAAPQEHLRTNTAQKLILIRSRHNNLAHKTRWRLRRYIRHDVAPILASYQTSKKRGCVVLICIIEGSTFELGWWMLLWSDAALSRHSHSGQCTGPTGKQHVYSTESVATVSSVHQEWNTTDRSKSEPKILDVYLIWL